MVLLIRASSHFWFSALLLDTPNYDSLECAAEWAKESLNVHRADKREFLYTRWVRRLHVGDSHG